MKKATIDFELHEATIDDFEELVNIRIAAMRESLENIGRFDALRARSRLLNDFKPENTKCIVYQNTIIGFIIVRLENEKIILNHLYVKPEFQNTGIGSSILGDVIERGEKEGRDIRLITLKRSRANEFYLKNGFKFVGSTEYDNVYVKSSVTITKSI